MTRMFLQTLGTFLGHKFIDLIHLDLTCFLVLIFELILMHFSLADLY